MTSWERRYTEPLDGTGTDRDDAGGKAAALDRLVEAGFPVPPALVVHAGAYRAFVRHGPLEVLLKELRDEQLPEPEHIETVDRQVEAAFLAAPMPADMETEISAALAHILAGNSVAIRSSATAEDQAAASFAGQYRTFLGITSVAEGLNAVRRCWASLWSTAVRAYRRWEGVPEDEVAMAVVIQAMAPAEWSGVVFTQDPQGEGNEMRVEAVAGLGDDLVSGRVTPLDFRIDRRTLAVRTRSPDPPPPWLEDLARLALRVERRAAFPQDIEWAHTSQGLQLLQARPITVVRPLSLDDDGFDSSPLPGDTFTPRGLAEMLPAAVPPLLWSINGPMVESAFRTMFARLRVDGLDPQRRVVARFRGRAALNLSLLREVAEMLPGGSATEVERQYLGRALSDTASTTGNGGLNLAAVIRNWRARRRIVEEVQLVCTAVECVRVLHVEPNELPAERLLAYRAGLRDLAWRTCAAEVAASGAAGAAYRALELVLTRWLGERAAAEWAQRLTAGTLAESAVGAVRMRRLADVLDRHAASCPGLRETVVEAPPEEARAKVAELGRPAEKFLAELDDTVRGMGSMGIYAGVAWEERPEAVWQQLAAARRSDAGPIRSASGRLEEALRSSARWRAARILTGQVVDLRRRLLRRLVDDATRFLRLREEAKSALLVLGGEERRVIRDMIRRLQASGQLSDADDAWLLADTELETMVLGREPVSAEEMAQRSAAFRRMEHADPLPETFIGTPHAVAPVTPVGPVLAGWAASPGVARGRARIIPSLAEARRLEPGEVIVAHSSDPSWTPLFVNASAIVLEEGGPLSHAAIVAREFGLPAVLNVPGATRHITTGEQLEVDGRRGLVRRIPYENAET